MRIQINKSKYKKYIHLQDWWRVFGVVVALGLTVVEVGREVAEMIGSRRKLRSWQSWCEHRTNDDLRCTHPMWPEVQHLFLPSRHTQTHILVKFLDLI